MAYLALLAGCFACSTSVLWIKLSRVDPVLLSALRLAISAALLAPWALSDWRRHRAALNGSHLRDTALPGVVLALHFVSWIIGARMTLASNGSLVVNLTPIATPFLLAAFSGERVTPREVLATCIAAAGLAVLFVADYRLSAQTLAGDLVCLGSMLLFALYLVLGRRYRHHPTTLLYVTPLYAFAAASSLALWLPFGSEGALDWRREWLWVALLSVVPTVIGHSLLNQAMRRLRGQVVAVMNLSQFVFAGLLAWAVLGERPEAAFYGAAALVVAAVAIAAGVGRWRPRGTQAVTDAT